MASTVTDLVKAATTAQATHQASIVAAQATAARITTQRAATAAQRAAQAPARVVGGNGAP